jgi:hypothetical protein
VYGRLAPPSLTPQGLLVRKDVAEAQVRDTTRGTDGVQSPPRETGDGPGPESPSDEPDKKKVRRFFGSVEIDAAGRPIKAFEAILNAVVMELQRTQGAKVKLTLEISAEAPDGFADSEVSVVRDNAKQLKFNAGSTGFEE